MRRTGLIAHERYFWHDPGPSAGGRRPDGAILQVAEPADLSDTKRRLLGLLEATEYSHHLTRILPRMATVEELQRMVPCRARSHRCDLSHSQGGKAADAGGDDAVGDALHENSSGRVRKRPLCRLSPNVGRTPEVKAAFRSCEHEM